MENRTIIPLLLQDLWMVKTLNFHDYTLSAGKKLLYGSMTLTFVFVLTAHFRYIKIQA